MKTLLLKSLSLGMLISTTTAFGQTIIQTRIVGTNSYSVPLPKDGSNCDPSVIESNLKILIKSNVL